MKIRESIIQLKSDVAKMNHKLSKDGESALECAIRLENFLMKLTNKHSGKQILIVSHGNIMRSFLVHIGWAKYNELPHGSIENTGYFILEVDGDSMKVKHTSGVKKMQ